MRGGIGRKGGGERHQLRFSIRAGVFRAPELNQFDAGLTAVGIRIGGPDSVHGVVIVAGGVFDGTAVSGDAGEGEIDGGVLRGALPEGDEIGFGFVEAPGIVAVTKSSRQAELVLRIAGIAGEGSAKGSDGVVVTAAAGGRDPESVKLAAAGLLIGVVTCDEMVDGGESSDGGKREDEQDDGCGTGNKLRKRWLGERARHTSYHDNILKLAGCRCLARAGSGGT